jgi:hypothetical protein
LENSKPALVYNHGIITKSAVPTNRFRSTYIHPIYTPGGEVLTDDFPTDHFHHRGLFWGWPHVRVRGQNYDLWDLRGIEQRFERWIHKEATSFGALLAVENGWFIKDEKVMQERVWLYAHPSSAHERVFDIQFFWTPLKDTISLQGAEGKSYGGLTLRFATNKETTITTQLGNGKDDLPVTRLPWADLSGLFNARPAGASIFISPDHPDYPPEWLTRHYGVLCVGWPGVKEQSFAPGRVISCSYRVWIHEGKTTVMEAATAYQSFLQGLRSTVQAGNREEPK